MNSDVEGNGPGLISGSQGIYTEELKKTTKPLKQQSIFWPRFERVTWRIAVRNTRSPRRQHECRGKVNIKRNMGRATIPRLLPGHVLHFHPKMVL